MRKISLYFLAMLTIFMGVTSCDQDDQIIDDVIASVTSGAILRTRSINNGTFNRFDTSSLFSVTVEEQDEENGGLLSSVDVMIAFNDNQDDGVDNGVAEQMLTSIPAADFGISERGLPETTFSITLAEALSAAGLVAGQFDGGDNFVFRFIINLTDGTTWTTTDVSSTVAGGSFFSTPYQYTAGIACIPVAPVTGTYTLNLEDTFGDGWDGAFLTVTIDGVSEDFTIDDGSEATFDVMVPATATSLVFSYTPGNFESEHIWEIIAPNGDTAAAGSPGPGGDITLNICT